MTTPKRRRSDFENPDAERQLPQFGWRGRLIGALVMLGGVLGYLADVVPFETKRHATDQQAWIARDIAALGAWDREYAERVNARLLTHEQILDELLRDQIRVMAKLGLDKYPRRDRGN